MHINVPGFEGSAVINRTWSHFNVFFQQAREIYANYADKGCKQQDFMDQTQSLKMFLKFKMICNHYKTRIIVFSVSSVIMNQFSNMLPITLPTLKSILLMMDETISYHVLINETKRMFHRHYRILQMSQHQFPTN